MLLNLASCTLPGGSVVEDGAIFKSGNPCMPDW